MIEVLNNSKFFLGIMLLLLNLGSRHLVDEFSTNTDEYNRNLVMRRFAIFAVCFVGTRDLITSILLTAGFVILAQGVSSKNREGMANKKTMEEKKVDQPAHDTSAPPMFVDTMDPSEPSVRKQ